METISIPDRFLEKKKEKTRPIDEKGRGCCCPACGSNRIIIKRVYSVEQALNHNTGKQIYKVKTTPVSYKYECSGCSWVSGWFKE